MKPSHTIVLAAICLFIFPSFVYSAPAGYIIYAEGKSFSVISGSKRADYDIFEDDVTGMEIWEGETISTEDRSFLEIQLAASSNVIKVSESTTFKVVSAGGPQGGALDLSYGRVRAKVSKLVGGGFSITGPSAVAGVRGTDFGYDFIFDPQKGFEESMTQIYCFEGTVEVKKIQKPAATEATAETAGEVIQTIVLTPDQMVSINLKEISRPTPIITVSAEVNEFWDVNDFAGTLLNLTPPEPKESEASVIQPESVPEPAPAVQSEEPVAAEIEPVQEEPKPEPVKPADESAQKKMLLKKQLSGIGVGLLVSGLLIEGGGIATYAAGTTIFPELAPDESKNIGTAVMIVGGSLLTGAIVSFISSVLMK